MGAMQLLMDGLTEHRIKREPIDFWFNAGYGESTSVFIGIDYNEIKTDPNYIIFLEDDIISIGENQKNKDG